MSQSDVAQVTLRCYFRHKAVNEQRNQNYSCENHEISSFFPPSNHLFFWLLGMVCHYLIAAKMARGEDGGGGGVGGGTSWPLLGAIWAA